jgi:hypothetical protein
VRVFTAASVAVVETPALPGLEGHNGLTRRSEALYAVRESLEGA